MLTGGELESVSGNRVGRSRRGLGKPSVADGEKSRREASGEVRRKYLDAYHGRADAVMPAPEHAVSVCTDHVRTPDSACSRCRADGRSLRQIVV